MGIKKPTNTHVFPRYDRAEILWVFVGIKRGYLPENQTHILKTWIFLDTMKPTFKGSMKGGSNLSILFRKAQ